MTSLLDIGPELVRARRARGMSQRELAGLLGVRQQQIARWEASGYRTASLARVAAAAAALGVGGPEPGRPLIAAESGTAYATATAPVASAAAATPVRDLGEIASRIRDHGATFRDVYHFDGVGVFGSFAAGRQTPESDVDLLVETADPGGYRFVSAVGFVEEILGRKADLVRPHLLRTRLRERVLSEVVNVWKA